MSQRFVIRDTPLAGLRVLLRQPLGDQRGYLERMYCADELEALVEGRSVVQINHTYTFAKGTVRGMHYQLPPHAETKFVSCLRGEVFDVAVDLRAGSPTFLQWHAELLSAENHKTLVIPEGFAHGFQTLSEDCEMLYFHTKAYEPTAERGLSATDPHMQIQWPLPVGGLSPRDLAHSPLDATFTGIML